MAKPDPEKLRKSLHASVDKYVKQQARNTIALNAERDPACEGYARVPGPDACDFCITMGAHSRFYRTRETAGGGVGHGSADDRYHPYCNCPVVIVFRKGGKLVARDPETGEAVPYDAAEMVRRYREAGAPTFEKNRAREAARRRADRAAGAHFEAGGKQARKAGANTGAKLAEADFDAAMRELADATTLGELHAAGARIVGKWPKDAEGLRHRGQWAELSKLAKERERKLKEGAERRMRRDMAGGLRRDATRVLDSEEIRFVCEEADEIGIPTEILRFNEGVSTSYDDFSGLINVKGDVFPDTSSTFNRDLLSVRATLAHEYYGHQRYAGTTLKPGDWRDEFRASYRAAIDAPNLSDEDRMRLMVDAYERAAEMGVTLKYTRDYRKIVYGY